MNSLANKDKRRINEAKEALNAVKSATSSVPGKSKKSKNRSKMIIPKGLSNFNGVTQDYINCLANPFMYPPVRVGFGTMAPTEIATAYRKVILTTSVTSGSYITTFNPDAILRNSTDSSSGAGAVSNRLNYWIANQLYNTGGSAAGYDLRTPFNISSLLVTASASRTIAAGIRVTVAKSGTATPSLMSGANLYGINNVSDLDSYANNDVFVHPASQSKTTVSGNMTIQKSWIPLDVTDFEFTDEAGAKSNNELINPIIISTGSYTVGDLIFIEAIQHVEYVSGVGTSSVTPEPTAIPRLSDYYPSLERMWHAISKPVNYMRNAIEWSNDNIPFILTTGSKVMKGYNELFSKDKFPGQGRRLYGLSSSQKVEESKEQRRDSLVSEAELISDELSSLESQGKLSSNYQQDLKKQLDNLLDLISQSKRREFGV